MRPRLGWTAAGIAPKRDAGDTLIARYPDRFRMEVVPNANHALLPEQPERIAQIVLEFLASL